MCARDFPEACEQNGPRAFENMSDAPAYLKNGVAAFAHLQSKDALEKEFYFWWYQNHVDTRFPTAWKAIKERIAHLPSFMPSANPNWIYYPWWFVGIIKTASEGGTVMNGTNAHSDHLGATGTFHVQHQGTKRWVLSPLKHCHDVCGKEPKVVDMQPGQFLSLNTDYWVHETQIIPAPQGKDTDSRGRPARLVMSTAIEYLFEQPPTDALSPAGEQGGGQGGEEHDAARGRGLRGERGVEFR